MFSYELIVIPYLIFCSYPLSPSANPKLQKMLDFPEEVAMAFEKSDTVKNTDDVRLLSGIDKLLLGSSIQDHLFEPCGYSINALSAQAYITIHVAPEVKKSTIDPTWLTCFPTDVYAPLSLYLCVCVCVCVCVWLRRATAMHHLKQIQGRQITHKW